MIGTPPTTILILSSIKKSNMQEEIFSDNLYELPICTICLQQLSDDMSSLACGHVFHISCITQHFQYRGSCPYCQKRALLKEIRPVIYPVIKNNNASTHLNQLLAGFEKQQGDQIKSLLKQIKALSQSNEINSRRAIQNEKDNEKLNKLLSQLKIQSNVCQKEIEKLRQMNKSMQQEYESIRKVCLDYQGQNRQNRQMIQELKQKNRDLEHLKTLQKVAFSCSEEVNNYRKQLEFNNTSPELRAKSYFQMLQLKNLSLLKSKEKEKDIQEKYRLKEEELVRLKEQLKVVRIQMSQNETEKNKIKKKYDEIRVKFKQFIQKNKNKFPQLQEQESLSINFQTLSKGKPQKSAYTVVQKPKVQQKVAFGNSNLKKRASEQKQVTIKNFMM